MASPAITSRWPPGGQKTSPGPSPSTSDFVFDSSTSRTRGFSRSTRGASTAGSWRSTASPLRRLSPPRPSFSHRGSGRTSSSTWSLATERRASSFPVNAKVLSFSRRLPSRAQPGRRAFALRQRLPRIRCSPSETLRERGTRPFAWRAGPWGGSARRSSRAGRWGSRTLPGEARCGP